MEDDGTWKLSTGLVALKGLCWLGTEIPWIIRCKMMVVIMAEILFKHLVSLP